MIRTSIVWGIAVLASALSPGTEFEQFPLRPDQAADSVAQKAHTESVSKPILTHEQELLNLLSSVTETMLSMTCHERTTEYRNGKQKGVRDDDIQLTPLGDEIYSNITRKRKHYRVMSRVPHQAWGDYTMIFDARKGLSIQTQTQVGMADDGALTVQFELDQNHSSIEFYGDRYPGSVGHLTTITVSPNRRVITIYNVAENPIPGVRKADTLVTLSQTESGTLTNCLLPVTGWDRNIYTDGTVDKWESTYDSYKRFQAESKLIVAAP